MEGAARELLLDAMLVELVDKGYGRIDVEGVRERCGITAEEFSAEFADLDACLFAAYERLSERLTETVRGRCEPGAEWPDRIRCGLEALLEELAAEPEMARALTRSFPSIRTETYQRYMGFLESFVPFFTEGRELSTAAEELPGEVEMLAVGAAETIILEEIEAGRASRLPSMGPSILFSLLVPFLGPEEASAAMRSAG
jgi:AcrR family transcriptional regulator